MATVSRIAKPKTGEETPLQSRNGAAGQSNLPPNFRKVLLGKSNEDGRPAEGTFTTYRQMRRNPTIALARQIATAPCRVGEWTIDADDDADESAIELVQSVNRRLFPSWVNWACQALDFGFETWETVWEVIDGALVPSKLKPLLPDITEICVDQEHGNFAGVKQGELVLPPEKCVLYTYDESEDSFYGRSRHENCRETCWADWETIRKRRRNYFKRVSGAVPMIEYPEGESTDASGTPWPHYILAQQIAAALEDARAVVMPGTLLNNVNIDQFLRNGGDPSKLRSWTIGFLESKDSHGAEFDEALKYEDQLMMRGWLVPERGAIEAQKSGSRADSQTHGDIAVTVAEVVFDDMLRAWTSQVIDRVLEYNYGEKQVGKIRMKRVKMDAGQVAFYQALVTAILSNPANIDIAVKAVDFNTLLDEVGLPKAAETVHIDASDVKDLNAPPDEVAPDTLSMAKAIYERAFGTVQASTPTKTPRKRKK